MNLQEKAEQNRLVAAKRALEVQERYDLRKRNLEILSLYKSTRGYPWSDPDKWNVNSLAAKFNLTPDEIQSIINE